MAKHFSRVIGPAVIQLVSAVRISWMVWAERFRRISGVGKCRRKLSHERPGPTSHRLCL